MKMRQKYFSVAIIIICLSILLCACGKKEKSFEGTWRGQRGGVLILKKDGICKYTQDDWTETLDGVWYIEKDKLIVEGAYEFDIYAELEGASEALLFQADESFWNDELYIKSK